MGTPIGNLGGIAIQPEATYGTVAGAAWEWQHPGGATLGNRREIITPTLLTYAAHTARQYSGKYADGDLVLGLDFDQAVIGNVLALAGVATGLVYDLGDGSIPDLESVSALVNYGGGEADPTNAHEYIYPGVRPNALRFDIVADTNATITLVGIAQPGVKTGLGLATAPAPPAEANVAMPDSFVPATIGVGEAWETEVCLQSATFELAVPKTGFDHRCLGGVMLTPITAGRPEATFTLNLDFDDQTDNDTISIYERFNAGLEIGDISIGNNIVLKGGLSSGETPPLQDGAIDYTLTGMATSFEITTT